MNSKISMLALSAVAAVAAGSLAAAAPATGALSANNAASLVIHHQTHGCHAWAANGGAYKAQQTITLRRGGSISVRNDDVMPHKLIETRGPAITITRLSRGTSAMGLKGTFPPSMLARMHAASKLTFSKPGVYTFTTKAGEDYMAGIKTTGEDNALKLTVTVT